MSSPRQRAWYHDVRQHALLEFSRLRHSSPDGVYVTLKPGDPTQWQGILFVREGPYSPAILRFQIMFPPDYPVLPPVINFVSDIFHPLVTPLTTYTYTTGSAGSDTVSATDEERLPPGGFNLGHGFPQWFGRESKRPFSSSGSSRHGSLDCLDPKTREGDAEPSVSTESSVPIEATPEPASPAQSHMLAPLSGGLQAVKPAAGVLDVLHYIRHTFSDESALDNLPLEAAGNAGAWKAWRAYRASKGAPLAPAGSAGEGNRPDEWNWDGVWEQRVRRGIDSSISDSVLFGSAASSSDSLRFVNMDSDSIDEVRAHVVGLPTEYQT